MPDPRVKDGPFGCTIMEFDLNVRYRQVLVLRFFLKPFGFWRKLGFLFGIVKPGDVAAEIESSVRDGRGDICYIDMLRYPDTGKVMYKGYGRALPGPGVLRILVDESVRKGHWDWSFELETLDN